MSIKPLRHYIMIAGLLMLICFPLLIFMHILPLQGYAFYIFVLILIFTVVAGYHDLKKIFR